MKYTWGYIKDAILAKLDLEEEEAMVQSVLDRIPFYANEVITQVCSAIKPKCTFFEVTVTEPFTKVTMPDDFISFGDDVNTVIIDGTQYECHDDDLTYKGYNEILLHHSGKFSISYNARWYTFDKDIENDVVLNIPMDILDCIPSYVAHQCSKVDDEIKASIFRNEYELMLSRIDNTQYNSTKSFKIGGDW